MSMDRPIGSVDNAATHSSEAEAAMDGQTHTFRLVESQAELAAFWAVLVGAPLLGYVLLQLKSETRGAGAIPYMLILTPFWILVHLRSIVNVAWRPTLTVDPQGITWQRRGMQPRVMPWGQITRMWTVARIRDARSRTRPEMYYIIVETLTSRLRIREGVVNNLPDLDVIGRVIDEVSMRFGTGLRIEDRAELMGPWREE
jgi:hypothetical protein